MVAHVTEQESRDEGNRHPADRESLERSCRRPGLGQYSSEQLTVVLAAKNPHSYPGMLLHCSIPGSFNVLKTFTTKDGYDTLT